MTVSHQLELFQMFRPRSIVIVDSPYTPRLREVVTSLKSTEFVVVPSLEGIVLAAHSVCVVSTPAELSREEVRANQFTPVLFLGSEQDIEGLVKKGPEESLDAAVQRALKENNLFDIANIGDDFERINEALDQKNALSTYLEQLPPEKRADLLKTQYDPPRFQTFFGDVRTEYHKYQQQTSDIELANAFVDREFCHLSSPMYKVLERRAATQVLEFLRQRELKTRKDPLLGKSQTGEGGAIRFYRIPSAEVGVSKGGFVGRLIVADYDSNSNMKIAQQRYSDAKRLSNDGEFRTPKIYRPLHLDEYAEDELASFLLMEEIAGPTLDSALAKIQNELDSDASKRSDYKRHNLLKRIQKELVEKYVDDIAVWQRRNIPTFVRKPARGKVIAEYTQRINDFPEIFAELIPAFFSKEENDVYLKALECLEHIDDSPQNIVRVRDASLPNVILRFDKAKYDKEKEDVLFDNDDTIRNTTSNGSSVDRNKINNIFHHVDLHYRYGHIFEDLAHIITAHETSFLIKSNDEDEDHGKTHINDKAIRKLSRRFMTNIGRDDLANDRTSLYLMFFYRSARKLKLYAKRYIRNAIEELSRDEITRAIFDRRKKTFQEKVAHHARSCYIILSQLRKIIKEDGLNVDGAKRIDAIYGEGRSGYSSTCATSLEYEINNAKDANSMLYARVTALALTYNKLKGYLRKDTLQFDNLRKNGTNGTS